MACQICDFYEDLCFNSTFFFSLSASVAVMEFEK